MSWSEIVLAVLILALVLVAIGLRTASRLDRLHRKVVAARLALDAQLTRRSMVAGELAGSGVLDPASTLLLVGAVVEATTRGDVSSGGVISDEPDLVEQLTLRRDQQRASTNATARAVVRTGLTAGFDDDRLEAESDLTRTLRTVLSDEEEVASLYAVPASALLLDDLAEAWYRVELARRFHNESVAQVLALRNNALVRVFHLAGHAPLPTPVDLDDSWPPLLRPVVGPAAATTGPSATTASEAAPADGQPGATERHGD